MAPFYSCNWRSMLTSILSIRNTESHRFSFVRSVRALPLTPVSYTHLLSCLKQVRDQLHDQAPLIHCITHPIVVNDCANAVLALGGRPIMAEHPAEVADISASAAALTVSLGNIKDARAESMLLAGKAIKRMEDAENAKRASVIDLVGITCSPFRMELAKRFIKECKPDVYKRQPLIRFVCSIAFIFI